MAIDLAIDHLIDAELIGRGGFGTVYAATDTRFERRVAVKVLGQLSTERDRAAFDRECRIMGRMSMHPHVVTVHEAGYSGHDSPYLVMELIDGGSLAQRLASTGPIPWPQAVDYLIPVADALGHGHNQGIEHRDVKPDNILLAGEQPRLTDFGIARLRDATGATSTQITASWLHAPPETFENKRDHRSDIYSLVSTLQTLIAGVAPFFSADDESLSPLMFRLLSQPAPRLQPELGPPELADLLEAGLSKDPADRPQTADHLIAALHQIVARHPANGLTGSTRPIPVDYSQSSTVIDPYAAPLHAVAAPSAAESPTATSSRSGQDPTTVIQEPVSAPVAPARVQARPMVTARRDTSRDPGRPRDLRPLLVVAAIVLAVAALAASQLLPSGATSPEAADGAATGAATVPTGQGALPTTTTTRLSTTTTASSTTTTEAATSEKQSKPSPKITDGGTDPKDPGSPPAPPIGAYTVSGPTVSASASSGKASVSMEAVVSAGGAVTLTSVKGPCKQEFPSDTPPPNTYRFNFESTQAGTCTFTLSQNSTATHGAGPTKTLSVTITDDQVAVTVVVPDVTNLTQAAAEQELAKVGLVASVVLLGVDARSSLDGHVISQDVAGGTSVSVGRTVKLTVGTGQLISRD